MYVFKNKIFEPSEISYIRIPSMTFSQEALLKSLKSFQIDCFNLTQDLVEIELINIYYNNKSLLNTASDNEGSLTNFYRTETKLDLDISSFQHLNVNSGLKFKFNNITSEEVKVYITLNCE